MNHKLPSFRSLLKRSFAFYKSNWQKITFLFLPLEAAILFCFLFLDLVPKSERIAVMVAVIFFSIVSVLLTFFVKIVTVNGPLAVDHMLQDGKTPKPLTWYKSLLKKIVPLSVVLLLVGIANFGFVALVVFASGILFVIGSLLLRLVAEYSTLSVILSITFSFPLLYVALRYSIKFVIKGMFAVYYYIFEKRRGLDAVASSFVLTKGREFQIFWRTLCIWAITSIPFLVLVLPLNVSIILKELGNIYLQVMVLHQEPIIGEQSALVLASLDILASIASIIGVSLLVVMNYYLWRDIRDTAGAFEEVEYKKNRQNLKSLIIFGSLLFVVVFFLAMFYGVMYGA